MTQYIDFETHATGHRAEIRKDDHDDNSYLFTLYHEDHTIGNLITQELLADDKVLFAGYRIEHPLEDLIKIRVTYSDHVDRAGDMFTRTVMRLNNNIDHLIGQFDEQIRQIAQSSN